MKKHDRILFLGFFLLLVTTVLMPRQGFAVSSEAVQKFEHANELYRSEEYAEAAGLYRELTQDDPGEYAFFYNLGNAHYRLKDQGNAILAYERALTLSPRNKDVRDNLAYVNGGLEYRIQDKRNWYIQFAEKLLRYFKEREVLILSLGTFFLFIGAWVFVLYFRRGIQWGWFRKTTLGLSCLFLVLVGAKHYQMRVMSPAIILEHETAVHYGPSEQDQVAFRLGEGLKVYAADRREGWSRVVLVNDESGWVRNDKLEEIN